MQVPSRRAKVLLFVLVAIFVAFAGFAGDADAQVYRGTLKFDSSPFVFDVTLTLQPGGPALYRLDFLGRTIDTGILVASVNGSSVSGFIQTSQPGIAQCFFAGTYDGTTVSLRLDVRSCGDGGTVLLTRVG
jgi:hypothetical protein